MKTPPCGGFSIILLFGEGREDYLIRLCMVVDWCIDHPEYTAKIKVIPKKDYLPYSDAV